MSTPVPMTPDAIAVARVAKSKRAGLATILGLVVAPAMMGCTWLYLKDMAVVRTLGELVFYASIVLLAVSVSMNQFYAKALKNVSQDCTVEVPGVFGPVRQRYASLYDYAAFTPAQFAAAIKMHRWGIACYFFFFSAAGYLTVNFLRWWLFRR
jgi:hypothetical protein